MNPAERRLAILVDDHPIEYEISKGSFGRPVREPEP
jgi:response regulator of citrate/malate metabolism